MKTLPTQTRKAASRRRTVRVSHAPTAQPAAAEDNVWNIDAWGDEEDDADDLEPTSAFDLTGGEWEPVTAKVRRKVTSMYRRLF